MMPELSEWETFYVVVGAAAGALVGLQFVVMTLIAEGPPIGQSTGAAFATPTIIHFTTAFFLSALLSAPWNSIEVPAIVWGLTGVCGIAYVVIVARRMRTQTAYQTQPEDWLFHVVVPAATYAILLMSAIASTSHDVEALFGVGTATLFLLFIGIHNAWDSVSYFVFVKRNTGGKQDAGD